MHGNRSNIVQFTDNLPTELFKSTLINDQKIDLNRLGKPDLTKSGLDASEGNLKQAFPILGKEIIDQIIQGTWTGLSGDQQWDFAREKIQELSRLDTAFVTFSGEKPRFKLLESSSTDSFDNPRMALNTFFKRYMSYNSIHTRKQNALTELNKRISKTSTYINKTKNQLRKISESRKDSEVADLIMANIHSFTGRERELSLTTFDGTEVVKVNLKEGVTPVKHAQILYRKSKNKKIEIDTTTKNIEKREQELIKLLKEKDKIENASTLKEIETTVKKNEAEITPEKKSEFLEYEHDGFVIRVGRNAKNNDKLTFQHGYKEDLWLHVKDTKGSHVLVKYRSDRKFPKNTIERAAQLAAWFSKRKTEAVVPVIFTPRKYVRKRKGDPPGAVVVDKESVILVEPEN